MIYRFRWTILAKVCYRLPRQAERCAVSQAVVWRPADGKRDKVACNTPLGNAVRRYCSRIAWAAVVCALGVVSPRAAHAGPNVLLLWDDDQGSVSNSPPLPSELNPKTQALIAAMEAAGLHITLSDKTQSLYTGNNPAPGAFDVVLHLNGNDNVLEFMQSGSAVAKLVDYVENGGGGFITSQNTEAQLESVALSPLFEELMVIDRVEAVPSPAFGDMSLTPVAGFETHPLLTGLTPPIVFEGGRMTSVLRTYGTDPATTILRDELGLDAAAVRSLGVGRVVSFHHTGNFRNGVTLSDTLLDPEAQRLYINAVLWADQHAPTATITLEQARANASGAGFLVQFSEGVDGFDLGDVQLVVGGGLGGTPNMVITALNDRDFRVLVTGYSGTGTLQVNLLDDGTIFDQSFNANPLMASGTLLGPVCPADTIAPNLTSFDVDPFVVPLGERGQFTLTFNEPMDQAYPPLLVVMTAGGGTITASPLVPPPSARVESGLLAFYTFDEGTGNTVFDTSGVGTALDLGIAAAANTHWVEGGLSVDTGTILLSSNAATKISNACMTSNEVSVEAWVRPANATQAGPARMASLGVVTARNVALEQNVAAYEARVRTTTTTTNGLPELSAAAQVGAGNLQHVVYTRAADGTARVYVDDMMVATATIGGDFSGWNTTYKLALANELNQAFPWLGEFHLFAVYDRALSPAEVQQNFEAGPATVTPGDGVWLNATTYRVSLDRAVALGDQGTAQIAVSGAFDLAGNALTPQPDRPLGMISSTLVVSQEPDPFYVREAGEPFQFAVGVSGAIGGLNFQWYKQDDAKVFAPIGGNAPVLTFAALDLDDSGTYYCVISDVQASVQTSPSHLSVVASIPLGGLAGLVLLVLLLGVGAASLKTALR